MSASAPARPVTGRQGGGVRRAARWIQGWHGAQLVTLWAACVIVPWQLGAWRSLLVAGRLGRFLNPGMRPSGLTLLAGLAFYVVLPVGAIILTGIWLAGWSRRRRAGSE